MESKPENYFNDTYDLVKKYTDDRLLLVKIQTAKKTAKLTSKIIFIFITTILLFFTFLFLGFMLAYYFSEKFNSNFYGFSTVVGIYILALVLFIITYKNYFSGKVKDMVTKVFFENEFNDIDDDGE